MHLLSPNHDTNTWTVFSLHQPSEETVNTYWLQHFQADAVTDYYPGRLFPNQLTFTQTKPSTWNYSGHEFRVHTASCSPSIKYARMSFHFAPFTLFHPIFYHCLGFRYIVTSIRATAWSLCSSPGKDKQDRISIWLADSLADWQKQHLADRLADWLTH